MSEVIRVERDGDVLVLRLVDPRRRNVLTLDTTTALADAVEDAGDAVVIALLAEGEHFCVGGDVVAFGAAADPEGFIAGLATAFHRLVLAMRTAGAPVIVGQRGWAAGAGMSLVLAADYVVAGRSAMLQPAYSGIGVTPDGGMTWTLPRIVGQRRALSILLANRALTAADAQSLGIVDDVVPDADVDARALALATQLAGGASGSLTGIKRLVHDGAERGLGEHLEAEGTSIAARAASPEGQEGIHAFLERRVPDFRAARTPR